MRPCWRWIVGRGGLGRYRWMGDWRLCVGLDTIGEFRTVKSIANSKLKTAKCKFYDVWFIIWVMLVLFSGTTIAHRSAWLNLRFSFCVKVSPNQLNFPNDVAEQPISNALSRYATNSLFSAVASLERPQRPSVTRSSRWTSIRNVSTTQHRISSAKLFCSQK
mgnify:CR=1 FL=1